MICAPEHRLGRHGSEEIKTHPFFTGVDWDTIRNIEAPFVPNLKSITDTSYFPTEDLEKIPEQPQTAGMSFAYAFFSFYLIDISNFILT